MGTYYFFQRRAINSELVQHKSLKEIAEITGLDPTSVSKEIIRNRIKVKQEIRKDEVCKKIIKFPRCCNGCNQRYLRYEFDNRYHSRES